MHISGGCVYSTGSSNDNSGGFYTDGPTDGWAYFEAMYSMYSCILVTSQMHRGGGCAYSTGRSNDNSGGFYIDGMTDG